MTDDDTTSSESDPESDREDEDDNLTEQTRGERLLDMAKEAIKAEELENNARTRAEAPRPTSSAPSVGIVTVEPKRRTLYVVRYCRILS